MPVKVLLKGDTDIQLLDHAQFSEKMGIPYLSQLSFKTAQCKEAVEKRCRKAHARGIFTEKQLFAGHYYAKELHNAIEPAITIAWIDAVIGYGVWAHQDIAAHTYIGEYTGIVRRPTFFKDWDNYYCFNYYITMNYWEQNIRAPYLIDAQDAGNFTRYINHSDKPNLDMISAYHSGMLHIIFYARALIPKGTQLSYDYGPIYWEKRTQPLPLTHSLPIEAVANPFTR